MRRFPIAIPTGHFMGLAPLDVWVRLLIASKGRVGPRYWLRLGFALATSLLATIITLPERLLLWPVLAAKFRGREPRFVPKQDTIVIVGYFRSGTTHLHNLLATHPDLVTPKWVQAMSPQGFWVSWTFLRLALVPFLPNTRPQDDVAFGPDWPAEDDFAHNNWALVSSLPGRLVLPQERARWAKFDGLEGVSERERTRWQRAMAAFAWKVSCTHRNRALLLKSPSHTGKVRELDRLFGGRVRFVHISRAPAAVVQSNVAMHARLESQSLQPLPSAEATREVVITEYVEAEERFLAHTVSDRGADFQPVRVRYEEFVAEPIEELGRIYEQLGLRWDDQVRASAAAYLEAIGDYTPRQHARKREAADPRLVALDQQLGADAVRFGDKTTGASSEASQSLSPGVLRVPGCSGRSKNRPGGANYPQLRGVLAVWVTAALGLGAWLLIAHLSQQRFDVLAWPLGGAVGAVALRVAGRGDWKLGVWAALGALALVVGSVWPLPEVAFGWIGPDRIRNIRTAYGSFNNNYLYLAFGMLTAYRYASRQFPRPPGI